MSRVDGGKCIRSVRIPGRKEEERSRRNHYPGSRCRRSPIPLRLLWYLFFLVAGARLVLSRTAACSAVTGLIRGGGCPSRRPRWSSAGGPRGCRRPPHPTASVSLSPICPAAPSPSVVSSVSRWGSILAISPKPVIRPPPIPLLSRSVNSPTQALDQSPERAGSLIDAYQRIHCCCPAFPSMSSSVAVVAALLLSCAALFAGVASAASSNSLQMAAAAAAETGGADVTSVMLFPVLGGRRLGNGGGRGVQNLVVASQEVLTEGVKLQVKAKGTALEAFAVSSCHVRNSSSLYQSCFSSLPFPPFHSGISFILLSFLVS